MSPIDLPDLEPTVHDTRVRVTPGPAEAVRPARPPAEHRPWQVVRVSAVIVAAAVGGVGVVGTIVQTLLERWH